MKTKSKRVLCDRMPMVLLTRTWHGLQRPSYDMLKLARRMARSVRGKAMRHVSSKDDAALLETCNRACFAGVSWRSA